jgi:hypothetical protein
VKRKEETNPWFVEKRYFESINNNFYQWWEQQYYFIAAAHLGLLPSA